MHPRRAYFVSIDELRARRRVADEKLMAYVDGELDAPARAGIEVAMRSDPDVEKRVVQYRALRSQIQAAYAAELSEPVPERLRAAAWAPMRARQLRRLRWRSITSLAASLLVVAIGVGSFAWHRSQSVTIETLGGSMLARGSLDQALTNQLAGDPAAGGVRVGLSFLAKSGSYDDRSGLAPACSRNVPLLEWRRCPVTG